MQGERITIDGLAGCSFSSSGSQPAGSTPGDLYVEREIRSNPTTCEVELEGAWLDEATAAAAGFSLDGETAPQPSNPELEGVHASYKWDGRVKGYVEDPPGIDVTSTTSRIRWNGGDCVRDFAKSQNFHWVWGSGWTDVQTSYWDHDDGCDYKGRRALGRYKNGVFCLTNDTFATQDVDFHAHSDGGSWHRAEVKKWGGCSWLLSTHKIYDPR